MIVSWENRTISSTISFLVTLMRLMVCMLMILPKMQTVFAYL